jgi:6-phosphogluconolactonase (cycloisomerase 2 family)
VKVVLHNGEILVPDLGCNKVWRMKFVEGTDGSKWEVLGSIDAVGETDGPRHIVIHPNGKWYLWIDIRKRDVRIE